MKTNNYLAKTKISNKNSISVPSAIRTKFNLKAGDILYWDIIQENNIIIRLNQENE